MHCCAPEKKRRRSPCGCDAAQHVSVYSGNPDYASTFAATAYGYGNCDDSCDRLIGIRSNRVRQVFCRKIANLLAPLECDKYVDFTAFMRQRFENTNAF